MKKYLLMFAFIFLFSSCSHDSKVDFPSKAVRSDLPVTKVVLYQNGVGYIERAGVVNGDTVKLQIRYDQVKDILKSLTVVDRKGGYAVNISMPVEKSRLSRLEELPEQVKNAGGLLGIASAFKGARCSLTTNSDTYQGRIVGVENIGNVDKPDYQITLMHGGGLLTVHKLNKIKSIKIIDKNLTMGLEKSLDVALNKGKWKPVNLTVKLNGKGTHHLIVSYVVEMPLWKPAYRIIVGENGKLLLQGWSVVDNLSGNNWDKIHLSLTAGTPLAFKYDLYTPLTVKRVDLTPRQGRYGEAPPVLSPSTRGYADEEISKSAEQPYRSKADKKRYRAYKHAEKRRYSRRRAYRSKSYAPKASPRVSWKTKSISFNEMKSSYKNLVSGTSVGSLFRYDIKGEVTIPDRSSALVTLINNEVSGKDVLYYIANSGSKNPYRAVRFKNTSGYVMQSGPIAIYRDGQFVGEALGNMVEKKATAFIPYAKEGKVIVNLNESWKNTNEKLIAIWNSVVRVESKQVNLFKYTIRNRAEKEFTIYIRRPIRTNWKVINSKNYIFEKNVYYAPFKLKQGKNILTIREETPVVRSYSIWYKKARLMLAMLIKNSQLEPKLSAKIKEVLKLWNKIAEIKRQMDNIYDSRRILREQQNDQRQNLKVLGKKGNRKLRNKIIKLIAKTSSKLNSLNSKWVELNIKKGEKERKMNVLFKMISFRNQK